VIQIKTGFLSPSNRDPLYFIKRDLVAGAVVELGGARALVIDDDPDVRALLCFALDQQGIHASEAEDGQSALALLEADRFDVLITDVCLPPPMNGIETVRRARKLSPTLRSLFISGAAPATQDHPILDDFVSKPFKIDEVVGCLLELWFRKAPLA
jgi:DNA-binding response OmpR family regulator